MILVRALMLGVGDVWAKVDQSISRSRLNLRVFSVAIALVPFRSFPAGAQAVISDKISCPACSVAIRQLVTIGDVEGPGSLLGLPRTVAADASGNFIVVIEGEPPQVFDKNGKFVKAFGAQGIGPGEFRNAAQIVVLPGDSILVLDQAGQRVTILDRDYRAGRTVQLPSGQIWNITVLDWPHRVLLNGLLNTPSRIGLPLHFVSMTSATTTVTRSFGSSGEFRRGQSSKHVQQFTSPKSGHVWTGDMVRYRLRKWDAADTPTDSVLRKPEYFANESSGFSIGGPNTAPPPKIAALEEDAASLLWVFVKVSRTNWKESWNKKPPRSDEKGEVAVTSLPAAYELYRTKVEVLDTKTRTLVAAAMLNELVVSVLPGGRVAMFSVTNDGTPKISIVELKLKR